LKKEEFDEKKKGLIKNLSTLELCPRCSHYICLKDGKCPHCGLVKKGDEWIMTKEAIKEKQVEKEKEKEEEEEEKTYGSLFDVLTYDK